MSAASNEASFTTLPIRRSYSAVATSSAVSISSVMRRTCSSANGSDTSAARRSRASRSSAT
jgi:hypothetical protein